MNLVFKQILTARSLRLCDRIAYKKVQTPVISTCSSFIPRNYCDDRSGASGTQKLPRLMEFPPVVWPSVIKYIKNWMFSNFIIRPYFDQEFSLYEFVEASKQAVQVVSESLQRSDFKSLEGLVDKEAIVALKNAVSQLSMSQRELLAINKEDIFYCFPYQVGVMFDEADKRWVEITMCYHVLKGLKQMQETGTVPQISMGVQPELQDKIFILNYRFIREFTKGVEDSWWINIVNHFQPHNLRKTV